MKYVLSALLIVGFVLAVNPRTIVDPMVIDDGVMSPFSGHGGAPRASVLIDSAGNQYTLALQSHESCSYLGGSVDALCIVNRGYSVTGALYVHSAPGDLSFWQDDLAYNQEYGPGRYPTSFAGTNGPYTSFPIVLTTWGAAGGVFSNGWFSGTWETPEDLGPGDQFCQTCIMKELPNGNMLALLYSTAPWGLQYRTLSNDLTQVLASGWLTNQASARYYWGYDCNLTAGIAYIFYIDDATNVYYRTTTDGITFTAETSYNMVWPNPYTNNEFTLNRGCQAVVRDNGQPMLVFSNMNADDLTYPQYGKVYVSPGSGQNCIQVSSSFALPDSECFYSTIATAGNIVAVSYLTPRNNLPDSSCWHDIHVTRSLDNGVSWSTPVNVTSGNSVRNSFPQLAKRVDVIRNRVYIVYATCINPGSNDMDLMWAYDNGVAPQIYINMVDVPVGIAEGGVKTPSRVTLSVSSNPAVSTSIISYNLPVAGDVSLRLYSAEGRLVKTLDRGHKSAGIHTVNVGDLSNGTYFVQLETPAGNASNSLVFLR